MGKERGKCPIRRGPTGAKRRLRVLLVEHDAMAQSLLAAALNHAALDTAITGTGSEALEIAKEQAFDLAVLDSELPDCSASAIAESLQRHSKIPSVLLWAKPDDALEHERRRLASELHDGLGQALTAASLMAAAIERKAKNGVAPSISELATLRHTLEQAQRDCRNLSHRHFGHAVGGDALDESLRSLIGREAALTEMECVYQGPADPIPTVPDTVSHHLYRIAQEAIGNAIRHSGGSRVTLILTFEPRRARISIRDDGCGCRPTNCGGGIGCLTMRYRAVSLGGTMTVRDATPTGTELVVEVPI